MNAQEKQLVADLFERLAKLEGTPRDADAERAISEGLRRAPNAIYPLVQTVLVQDEALRRADERIRELEGGAPAQPQGGGFLDSMRDMLGGGRPGSVPNSGARWGTQAQQAAPTQNVGEQRGGSFLGTAAAAAAGVIGGSLLMNSIGSMFSHRGAAFAGEDINRGGGETPWGNAAGSDLSRDAGLNDIGGGRGGGESRRAGLFDEPQDDNDDGADDDSFDTADFDGGGDFGGSDTA